jgi:hypothetical protein
MIQWTPGAGREDVSDKCWWPLYHKTFEAGKKVYIWVPNDPAILKAMKKEFRQSFKQFALVTWAESVAKAQELLKVVEV